MIFKRAVAKLSAQDWAAITIELAIVIVGVFIGTWVANWNEERAEKREAAQLIQRLRPQLEALDRAEAAERTYYRITRGYAATAFRGWSGNRDVSDRDFVVAAYQASQVNGLPIDSQTLLLALGAEQIPKIEDERLREAVTEVVTYNFDSLHVVTLQSEYRRQLRALLPDSIQHAIRASCDDTQTPGSLTVTLPGECAVDLPPADVALAAATLRAHRELAPLLTFHLAQTDVFLGILGRLEVRVRHLLTLMDARSTGAQQ